MEKKVMELWDLISELTRMMTDIPMSARFIFLAIMMHPGSRLIDIQKFTGLNASHVSRQCQQLQQIGMIEIRTSSESRREKNIYLTTKGIALEQQMFQMTEAGLRSLKALSKSYPKRKGLTPFRA